MKIYSAQVNAHGNIIVCGDTIARKSYRIIATGSYAHCLRIKGGDEPALMFLA